MTNAHVILGLAVIGWSVCAFDAGTSWRPGSIDFPAVVLSAWFCVVLLLSLQAVRSRLAGAPDYILALAIVALPLMGTSIYHAHQSHAPLPASASVTTLCVLGLFVAASLSGRPESHVLPALQQLRVDISTHALLTGAVLVSALAGGYCATAIAQEIGFYQWMHQPRMMIPLAPMPHTVSITVFRDFQCPYCRARHSDYDAEVHRLAAAYPGRIRFTSFDFPLSTQCNPAIRIDLHPLACDAALAVRAAGEVGRSDEMIEAIFAAQGQLSVEVMARLIDRFQVRSAYDLDRGRFLAAVEQDAAIGASLGVRGTPTYFVDGLRVPPANTAALEAMILHELKRA